MLFPDSTQANAITIVGVVGNAKIWSLGEAPFPYLYRRLSQGTPSSQFTVVARGNATPGEIAGLIRTETLGLGPDVFLTEVGTMEDHLGYVFFLPKMAFVMLSLIGALALILACMGLYGMVSYNVSRRTREMGIRLALGADRQRVINMVLKSGLSVIAIGAGLGIGASALLGGVLMSAGFLYEVSSLDPLAMLAAPILLGSIASLATYMPARRAARVDPVQALRAE
jgi:putative ABC transport system permease protein